MLIATVVIALGALGRRIGTRRRHRIGAADEEALVDGRSADYRAWLRRGTPALAGLVALGSGAAVSVVAFC